MKNEPIALDKLAQGHCLAVRNAYRLSEDGEALLKAKRWLSAINLFKLASEELAKVHMITQAASYEASNKEGWEWFRKSFNDHREKLRVLEYELHWNSYQDKNEFNRRVALPQKQREDALYVGLDSESNTFLEPGSLLGNHEEFATVQHQYVVSVLGLFMAAGLPTPKLMLSVYRNRRKRSPR